MLRRQSFEQSCRFASAFLPKAEKQDEYLEQQDKYVSADRSAASGGE